MKWYSKFALVGLSTVTVLGVAACGQKPESTSQKIKVEFFNQKQEMTDTLEEISRDFEKENPNIDIEITNVPAAGIVLKTRMLSGDVPDIVHIYPQNIDFQEWTKAGKFMDMTGKSYLNNLKNDYASFYEVDGKVYNVPLNANVSGIYYNKTKFKELGIEPPKTYAEFKEIVKKIKDTGLAPFAVAGSEGWTLNGYHQLSLITSAGSGDAVNDYLRFSAPNSISPDDALLKADRDKLDLLANNTQEGWRGAGYSDAIAAFSSGEALMMPQGSWALAAINQQEPEFEVGMFAFPGQKEGQKATVGAGDLALSVSATSKHQKESEAFVAYMTRPEVMQKYYDVDGSPVSVKGVKTDPNAPLAEISELAFTDRHFVWLAQKWTSEEDFFNLSANYLLEQNPVMLADNLNAFFNPMKADLD
ncbi:extracellular solute-binding protein [Streptococcus sp. 10F2]